MLVVQDDVQLDVWSAELEEVLVRIGHRFKRVDLRRRMRAYVRGPLGPVGRKNGWQLAEYAGHSSPAGLQHLLSQACWDPDEISDDPQEYVAEKLGEPGGVLIVDDTGFNTGFIKKGTTSAGVQRQYSGTAGRTENCQIGVFAAYASSTGRALVDRELYLPKSWARGPDRRNLGQAAAASLRSTRTPFSNRAPERIRATRWAPVIARRRACADSTIPAPRRTAAPAHVLVNDIGGSPWIRSRTAVLCRRSSPPHRQVTWRVWSRSS